MKAARFLMIELALLVLLGPAWVAGSEADQAMEARARGLVTTLQAGDVERSLEYVRDSLTAKKYASREPAEWKQLIGMLMRDLEQGEIQAVQFEDERHLRLVVRASRGLLELAFEFSAHDPPRIAGLGIEMMPHDDQPSGPALPEPALEEGMKPDQVASELGKWFSALAEQGLFSGTALVAVDGEAIFTAAHGWASLRFDVPNRLETRFDLGSINKTFTSIAVGQLHAGSKLELEDPIAKHLPDYPNAGVAQRVTVGQLLEHTSGLGDIFNEKFFAADKGRFRAPRDYFELFAEDELLFEPGSSRRYSNAGFMVLGAVIEAVAEMPYDEYVGRYIFEPAGMASTGFFAHDEPVKNVAIGYTRREPGGPGGTLRNNLLMLPVKGSPAGSAYSTVDDLLRFDNALRGYELLSPDYTRWLFGGPLPDRKQASAAPTGRLAVGAGFAGGAPGVSAVLELDDNLTVIILSNDDPPIAETIAATLIRALDRVKLSRGVRLLHLLHRAPGPMQQMQQSDTFI